MKPIRSALIAVAALSLGAVAVPPPAQAAQELIVKFCTYSAETPKREYTTSWKIRATGLWYCNAEGEDSYGYKRVSVKLQEWSEYHKAWVTVSPDSTSAVSKWGVPVTQVARAKCAKSKFRTVFTPQETDTKGNSVGGPFQTVISSSKVITSCS